MALVLALAVPVAALAQADPEKAATEAKPDYAAAKRHYKAGQAFMQMERFGEAVDELQQAYEITKDGLVMGQVATAYERAGDFEAALKAMRVYREALKEEERASADEFIKKYEQAIADGRSKKLVLPSEQRVEQEKKEAPTPAPEPEEPAKPRRLYTWIVAGAAGALALSALVVGLNAQSKYDELSDTCSPACPESDVDSVKTRALVTDILWGTAAAAAVTAGVLYFVEGRRMKKAQEEQREPGEGEEDEEATIRRIQVAPVVGRGAYGLGANIRF